MFLSNILWNLLWGVLGDYLGWRNTVLWFGGIGCAITTLLLYYVPLNVGANYWIVLLVAVLYGATLAAYVPLSALMPSLAPENRGGAMAILNLGAGLSSFLGPALVGLFVASIHYSGVIWVFSGLYALGAILTRFLRLPESTHEINHMEVPSV